MLRAFPVVAVAALLTASLTGRAQEAPDPNAAAQRPFRTGAHYVRVDAYPTRDGRPIPGLTADDFELLEDGKPQTIDRLEFIEHPEWTPLAERRDPNSQRDGFELARDPSYRIFVLYLDAFHVDVGGSHRLRVPLGELLDRMLGPRDLFGVLTPAQTPKDLLLGQLTLSIQEQLAKSWTWGLAGREHVEPQPGEFELENAFPQEARQLIQLRRLDKVYADLEELVSTLGELRDERKNVIYFSDYLWSPPSRFSNIASDPQGRGDPPGIGTTPQGTLTMGSRGVGDPDRLRAGAERSRLLSIDFDQRFRELLRQSRQANVSFYTVRPGGLDANMSMLSNGLSNLQVLAEETDGIPVVLTNDLRAGMRRIAEDLSSHYVLGYYTTNTRWDGGTRKITVRLKSTRETVRARREYRAPTGAEMSAIRDSQLAAATPAKPPSPGEVALSLLSRISPSARVNAYGTVIGPDVAVVAEISAAEMESGRWKGGADVEVSLAPKDGEPIVVKGRIEPGARGTVLRIPAGGSTGPWQGVVRVRGEGDIPDSDTLSIDPPAGPILGKPLAYRAASAAASAFRPLAAFQFRRTERVRLEWPLLPPFDRVQGAAGSGGPGPLESHRARLLDRTGKPLAVPVTTTLRESAGVPVLAADLNLAPLSNGDYLVEVTTAAGGKTDQQVVAIRVSMAR